MKSPLLITMQGPKDSMDVRSLSNFEAGLGMLAILNKYRPGITFGQVAAMVDKPETMAGWLTDLKHAVGDVKDGIGDVLKDTGTFLGGAAGSAVRLATDKSVISGASELGAAYATGGGSEAAKGILGAGGSNSSAFDDFFNFVSALGQSTKAKAASMESASVGSVPGGILPWAIGGVAVLFLVTRR